MALPLNKLSTLPQMASALNGWVKDITLVRRTQSVDADGMVVYADQSILFKGVIQPLSVRRISLKPEGQRAWQWYQIHAVAGTLDLQPNDQIYIGSELYKVMGVNNWDMNGFVEYECARDYQP